MTNEEHRSLVTKDTATSEGPFAAEISTDPGLETTVISLFYRGQEDPTRNMTVGIAPELGSNLFRFRVGEHDLIYSEAELLKRKDFTGDFVLWPLPNRIRHKRYTYRGKDYSLADVKREQGNSVLVHGLVFDRAWDYEQPIVRPDAVSVTTFVEITPQSPHYEAYPFDSRLSLTYTLTSEGISITYRVENKRNDTPLPFGFALHPYFPRLSGQDETYVSLPAAAVMEADDELLPTGRIFDVNKTMYAMYDLRTPRAVGTLNLDHVYTRVRSKAPAIIEYRSLSLQLHIDTTDDFTHIVIFAPPGEKFFCLEHQTCATDAINLHHQGAERREMAHLLEVPAEAEASGSIHYKVKRS